VSTLALFQGTCSGNDTGAVRMTALPAGVIPSAMPESVVWLRTRPPEWATENGRPGGTYRSSDGRSSMCRVEFTMSVGPGNIRGKTWQLSRR